MNLHTISEKIAAAVAANVISTPTLQTYEYVPDQISRTPCFFVAEPSTEYDRTFGGDAEIEIMCRVLAGTQLDRNGQRLIKLFCSTGNPESIKDAIEAARGGPGQPALDGAVDDLWVRRQQGYRWYEHPSGNWYVGAEIVIKVVE